ncbi:MAG: PEP/pyruvate-binding domain-containing protein [Deltaproteobacteria bacterium]|nr:PEP/pyruvate-binding domain-containing protein [Deltaproteobacteria bacterium]
MQMDLVAAYRMYQKMMQYPHLVESMRIIFLQALAKKGIVNAEEIEKEALSLIREKGLEVTEEDLKVYRGSLIDLYFANHFTDEDVENHINLARKEELFKDLYRVVNTEGATSKKIHRALKDFCNVPQGDLFIDPIEAVGVRVALINHFISSHLSFIGIGKKHITMRDVDEMLDHSYWNRRRPGKIGGKAAGMLLAYKIILPRLKPQDPELKKYVVIPESYYFNSGIFSDFIDYNGLYQFHSQKYKTREAIEEEYQNISQLFRGASYPPDTLDTFREFLDEVGEHPLILRSSSLLEDTFGSAFSGKYDSIFLTNQGDLETRLTNFVWGLKQVHMSTYGPSPILYRRDHSLLDFDEKMSVLVQKVVGRRYGKYFFPFSAGVAYSRNPFRWTPRIRREEGIVRLVFGLGTRAVDRVGSDYPRMIPLSHPLLRPEIEARQIMKYSQKQVDVLNMESGHLESVPFQDLMKEVEEEDRFHALATNQEGHLAPPLFKGQPLDVEKGCITFDNFLKRSPFVSLMKRILRTIEKEYGFPVDVEFAWDQGTLYILQCRTLAVAEDLQAVSLPEDVPREDILFTNQRIVSNSIIQDIEYFVYVDPKAYSRLTSYEEKFGVGRAVSRINRALEEKRYGLFGPGRWGSNDINLGVRVGYEDINRTLVLGEIAFAEDGSTPEVSFGTHFFNDLVEARIVPIAIYPDQTECVFREDFFLRMPNQLERLAPDFGSYAPVIRVLHLPECTGGKYLHVYQDGDGQRGLGFLDGKRNNGERPS